MNILGTPEISDYQGRTVTIEVTGVREQAVNKTASYTVRVPYSQMSQTMQRINRQGSKVVSVSLRGKASAHAALSDTDEANADDKAVDDQVNSPADNLASNQGKGEPSSRPSRKKGRKRH